MNARTADAEKSPERLEQEVDEARESLAQTVDILSQRLSPGQLLDQALGTVREHGGEFGRNLGGDMKRNPLALLLTGAGIAWLMAGSGNGSAASGRASGASFGDGSGDGRVRSALKDSAGKAREVTASTGDRARRAAGAVQGTARSAEQSMETMLREQPLLAGSLGVALGAALGAMLPRTQTEDELMGSRRDRIVGEARASLREKYEDVREAAAESDEGHSRKGARQSSGQP